MTGKFPKKCKTAHITPVYKKGNKLDTSKHRSISLLFYKSKVIEKTMYSTFFQFLIKFNYFYKKQFVFQNSHLTNHALGSIEDIRKALDNDEFACGSL